MTTFNTSDIGIAIRDYLEGFYIHHFNGVNRAFHIEQEIVSIDISDPSNLLVQLGNGQRFTVRIFPTSRSN